MEGLISQIINYLNNLGSTEITVLIVVAALLLLYLAYRWSGLGAVVALTLIFLIAYVLYANNVFDFYKQREKKQ